MQFQTTSDQVQLNLLPIDEFSVPNENLKDTVCRTNEHSSERAQTRSSHTAQKCMCASQVRAVARPSNRTRPCSY